MSWFKRKPVETTAVVPRTPDRIGIDAAVTGLSSTLEMEVAHAARELAELGDPAAVSPLIERLSEPDTGTYVGGSIISALGILGDPRGIQPTIDFLDRTWAELVRLRADRFDSLIDTCAGALESMGGEQGPSTARAFTAVWRNQWREVMALGEDAVPAVRGRLERAIAAQDTSQLDRLVPRLGQLGSTELVDTIIAAADNGAMVDPCVLALLDIGGSEAIDAVRRLPLMMLGTHVHEPTMIRHFEDFGRRIAAKSDGDQAAALRRLLEYAEAYPSRLMETCARQALQAAGADTPRPDPGRALALEVMRGGSRTSMQDLQARLALVLDGAAPGSTEELRRHIVAILGAAEPPRLPAALDLLAELTGRPDIEEAAALIDVILRSGDDREIRSKAEKLLAGTDQRVVLDAHLKRGRAEAADYLLRLMFSHPSAGGWSGLHPERVLGAWDEQLAAASGYDQVGEDDRITGTGTTGSEHETVYSYGTQRGDAAVEFLCRSLLPASSNVLHLVAAKSDARVVDVSPSFGEDSYITLSFERQRALTTAELARRGDPPYELAGYDTLPDTEQQVPTTAPPEPTIASAAPKRRPEVNAMLDLLIDCHYVTFDSVRHEGAVTYVPLWRAEDVQTASQMLISMGAVLITDPSLTTGRVRARGADGSVELNQLRVPNFVRPTPLDRTSIRLARVLDAVAIPYNCGRG